MIVEHPHGLIVSRRFAPGEPAAEDVERLLPEERARLAELGGLRRATYVAGRLALAEALAAIGAPREPILSSARGAPRVPAGWVGSISHKNEVAVAMAAPDDGWAIGVDVEELAPDRSRIADRILVAAELADVATLPEEERWTAILGRFSVKESIYKALDPFVARYVAFEEAIVTLEPIGVRLELVNGEGPFVVQASLLVSADEILSTARIRRSGRPA